jgi:5-methyltetrahydropteroyltriglutamate--homocysteine methyltransferase
MKRRSAGVLRKGADKVQIDFTEGRLAVKIDPSGWLLNGFIELNSLALSRFSEQERSHIGFTLPGIGQGFDP